jgi:mRNA-degrading endonuclease RelE of RelBE toxin-antitoxin system
MPALDGLGGVLDFLRRLPPKIQAPIARKIFALADDPTPKDSETLRGYPDLRRVDCGEFHIVYRVDEAADRVLIVLVDKRNDDEVCKRLRRLQG